MFASGLTPRPRNEGRIDDAGAAYLVRPAFPLVEGYQMSRTKRNGLDAANAEPVKSESNHATDFIATDENGQLSFLPPLPFAPTWPTKHTLEDKALAMLLDGRLIDHPEFEGDCGSWRLAAVVFNLRALGWPVDTIATPAPTETRPGRTVALYRLPTKYAAQALTGGAV